MCGIFGTFNVARDRIDATMAFKNLGRRGPDDRGCTYDENLGVFLAHTRLSIHDLSPLGHQPMKSSSGRYETVFNGEIYNFIELRRVLESIGEPFIGDSDTEVMLACFEHYGVVESVKRFRGMFAFAVLDRKARRIYLARDRMGEKPLYLYRKDREYVWASTLAALRAVDGLELAVSHAALSQLLRYSYVPAPLSIFENVTKIRPGCIGSIDIDGFLCDVPVEEYWSFRQESLKSPLAFGSDADAVSQLKEILARAVSEQMGADVPLGAFLSGGIDSSLIVALMQDLSDRKVKTFSLGFEDERFNEAPYAAAVANHLGTDHTELIISAREALEVIPNLANIYDEPFADSSQIPTCLVSRLARDHVTVALSGDGGDELFHGYLRYMRAEAMFSSFQRSPLKYLRSEGRTFPRLRRFVSLLPGSRITSRQLLATVLSLGETDKVETYHNLMSCNLEPETFVPGASRPDSISENFKSFRESFPRDFAFNDAVTYLPDDILAKVDRASMAVSLETRVPFLDHELVEFAVRLPLSYKCRNGEGKWLLRELLQQYVPRKLTDRPKKGFSVPLGTWLRGDLREWAESLLSASALNREGLFNERAVASLWNEHLKGCDVSAQLWPILVFQQWHVSGE